MTKPPAADRKSKDILRALMDPSRPDMLPWSSSELRAMLEHQFATSLVSERERFAELSHRSKKEITSIIDSCGCHTFGDVLQDKPASAEVIRLLKDYAKASLAEEGSLPKDVARVMYVMAILRGRNSGDHHVTSLDDVSVKREWRRCLTFGWRSTGRRSSIAHT
jgi:hypothetical protein